uniref:Uncharacterized protein n=1 Tax=Romanomermis culicivorax TaxID=13658 RepID=A0A915JST6_ROMCU
MIDGLTDGCPANLQLIHNVELFKKNPLYAQNSESRKNNETGRYQLFRNIMESFINMQILNQEEVRGMWKTLAVILILICYQHERMADNEIPLLEYSKKRLCILNRLIQASFIVQYKNVSRLMAVFSCDSLITQIKLKFKVSRLNLLFFFQRLIGRLLEKINDYLRRTISGCRRKKILTADDDDKHRCSIMNERFVDIFSLSSREKPDFYPFVQALRKIYEEKIKMDLEEYFVEGIENIDK